MSNPYATLTHLIRHPSAKNDFTIFNTLARPTLLLMAPYSSIHGVRAKNHSSYWQNLSKPSTFVSRQNRAQNTYHFGGYAVQINGWLYDN